MKQTIRHSFFDMRIIFRAFFVICITFLSVSCVNDVNINWSKVWMFRAPHYLDVLEKSCIFSDAAGGTKSIHIISTNTPWEVTDVPTWLSVDKKNGDEGVTINVTCEANPSTTEARAALLTIRSTSEEWEYSVSVSVSQVRAIQQANPESISVTFDGNGGRQVVAVTSNVTTWRVSSSQSWLAAEKNADGLSVILVATPNPNSTSRRAYVTVSTDDSDQQITVDQRAGNISATFDRLTFTHESSSQTIIVTSDAPWMAQTASGWVETLPSSASEGTTEVNVRVLANNSLSERSGYIYFVMADDNKVELPVSQGAISFSLSEKALDFAHSGGEKTITVTTNANWELLSDLPDWLTLSAKEGNGTTEVHVTAKENRDDSAHPRSATISFTPKEVGECFDVIVTQEGQQMNIGITPLQFTNKGGSSSFSFEATGNWTVTSSALWISLTPYSGSGSATCEVIVEENTGDEREAEIILSFYEDTYRIPVIQQGSFVTLSTNGLRFGSTGGSLQVDVSSNMHWDANIRDGANWLDINPKTGENDESLIVTASDNPSTSDRQGEVAVTPKDRQSIIMSVEQDSRYLNVSTTSVNLTAWGGGSELITVDTDGTVEVTTDADWLTINMIDDKSFIITATKNNTTAERKGTIEVSLTDLVSGEINKTISVSQDVYKLLINPEEVSFTVAGGTSEVIVETDGTFDITTDADWLTINIVSSHSFTLTAVENTSNVRTATVVVFLTNITLGEVSQIVSVTQEDGLMDHTYVDLGLPSGTLWATTNVGANSPGDFGDFFAWGETETKEEYSWKTYKWCNGDETSLTKYNTNSSNGIVDNMKTLCLEDDAANANWGGRWRMPTSNEVSELQNETYSTWTWTIQGGHNGYKITSNKNGNSIFLPATDCADQHLGTGETTNGTYWTSSLYFGSDTKYAQIMDFNKWNVRMGSGGLRYKFLSVRPVYQKSLFVDVAEKSLAFDVAGDTKDVYLTTDFPWTSAVSDSWITISPSSGTGVNKRTKIVITADENTGLERTAVVTFMVGSFSTTISISQSSYEMIDGGYKSKDGHYYVDLGLPSGLLWAAMNMGASTPWEYGDYYAWGEIKTKESYTWKTYKWCNGSETSLRKYNTQSTYGAFDNKTILDIEDDAACVNWGGNWRMPTPDDLKELINTSNCTWTWTARGGHNGYKVTSNSNGNSIFLPAAGTLWETDFYETGVQGYFRSSSLGESFPVSAWGVYFNSDLVNTDGLNRARGIPIRPVCQP